MFTAVFLRVPTLKPVKLPTCRTIEEARHLVLSKIIIDKRMNSKLKRAEKHGLDVCIIEFQLRY